MVSIRKILGRVCLAGWVALLLLRFDLLQAYGRGTGKNRVGFSPIDVASQAMLHSARLRGHDEIAKTVLSGIGFPGEFRRLIQESATSLPTLADLPKQAWESSQRWARESRLRTVANPSKDPANSLAATGCLLSLLLALRFPQQASMVFLASFAGLQLAMRMNEPTVRPTDDMGMYAMILAGASTVLLF